MHCAVRYLFIGGLATAALGAVAQAPVTDAGSLEARLSRLERSLGSSSLLEMHETMQRLRQEVRQLRGEIEVQNNEIRKLKQSQRQLYSDLDRRIANAGTASDAAGGEVASLGSGDETSPPPASTTGSATSSGATSLPAPDPAKEQQAYQAAFALLKSGKYSQASSAFDAFLGEYPNGRFSDNAQYWLGESYYVSRKFDPALKAFEGLLENFPDSSKRSHALLKIGFIHDETGRKDEARKVLNDLIAAQPDSTAAGLARKRLSRLQ